MTSKKALVVRIGNYAKPQHNLPGLEHDTSAFISILQKFGITDIETIVDDRATKSGIVSGLNRLVENTKAGDVRIFYYTGHGIQIRGRGIEKPFEAIVPYEASTSVLIPDLWMEQFLRDRLAPDCSFYGLYDCCNSGDLQKEFFFEDDSETGVAHRKEITWDKIDHDGPPELLPLRPEFGHDQVLSKAFVEDPALKNSVHFGAAEPELAALVLPMKIGGTWIPRSVFTRALELSAKPGLTIEELETRVSEAQETLLKDAPRKHTPQLSTSSENLTKDFFSKLVG